MVAHGEQKANAGRQRGESNTNQGVWPLVASLPTQKVGAQIVDHGEERVNLVKSSCSLGLCLSFIYFSFCSACVAFNQFNTYPPSLLTVTYSIQLCILQTFISPPRSPVMTTRKLTKGRQS